MSNISFNLNKIYSLICRTQKDGPIWIDKMNDHDFVSKTIEYLNSEAFDLPLITKKKIEGILHSISLVILTKSELNHNLLDIGIKKWSRLCPSWSSL